MNEGRMRPGISISFISRSCGREEAGHGSTKPCLPWVGFTHGSFVWLFLDDDITESDMHAWFCAESLYDHE